MSNKIDIIRSFKRRYIKNLKKYSDYNDSLYKITSFDLWKENLINRSLDIRRMFNENQLMIKEIDEIIEDELDSDTAYELYLSIKEFKNEETIDASIIIKIVNKLIDFYILQNDYEKLIYLYSVGALEEMEFFIRMDNNSLVFDPLSKYKKIIELKKYYKDIKNLSARRSIFMAYYNLIGPLSDLDSEVRNNMISYYLEVRDFYYSDVVRTLDKDNLDIIDEMHLINDVFITSFSYFIKKDKETQKKYFSIVNSLVETEDIDSSQKELIELIYNYFIGKYDTNKLIEELMNLFEYYLGDGISYDGTDQNINHFCLISDISGIICLLLKDSTIDDDIKYQYLREMRHALIDYIKQVPYKDYTSYFDDICVELFKEFLPFCKNIEKKTSLLNLLVLRRQPITYIHSVMVKKITLLIAFEILKHKKELFKPLVDLGYDTDEKILKYLGEAALYHDIGKCLTVGVINLQNRNLTEEEFKYIRMHPSKSIILLDNDKDFNEFYDVMLGHHKYYDGTKGYPTDFDNLSSKYKIAIDLITIADSIDAATDILGRNYTTGKNFYTLLEELIQFKGTRYNPYIVDFISQNSNLKKELDDITSSSRAAVYYDVYKEIMNS